MSRVVSSGGFYRGEGWVWIRHKSWASMYQNVFRMIRTGVAPMEFVVSGADITLRNPVIPRRIAERTLVGFTLDARSLEFTPERPVFHPTIKGREALVISWEWRGKAVALALAPINREDLDRLRSALRDAGVRPGLSEAEWSRTWS